MNLLTQSENYQISHKFETVFLTIRANIEKQIVIGDFYGEPTAAIIDKEERFAIIVGCGLIVYYFQQSFEDYRYDFYTQQWKELFREPGNVWWIERVVQKSHNVFEFSRDGNAAESGIYQLLIPSLKVQKLS